MPFNLRKSIVVGLFRFNVSKSGVGVSTGIKGFRIGTGPRGHYIHAGAGGFYYRAAWSGIRKKKERQSRQDGRTRKKSSQNLVPTQETAMQSYMTDEGVVMSRIVSADAEVMQEETQAEAVADLNEARSKVPLTLLVSGAGASFLL